MGAAFLFFFAACWMSVVLEESNPALRELSTKEFLRMSDELSRTGRFTDLDGSRETDADILVGYYLYLRSAEGLIMGKPI